MATITGQILVNDVRDTLLDEASTKRFSDSDLVQYINTALLWLALVKPDATAKTSAVQLTPGTKQGLPVDGLRLIDVPRNMGAAGATPGRVIVVADKDVMDQFNPNWHSETADTEVANFIYDERNPKVWWVSPPVHATTAVWAQLVYSAVPTAVTVGTLGSVLPVDDVYYVALKKGVLAEAFGKSSSAFNATKRRQYEIEFYQALGLKYQTDRSVSPNQPATAEVNTTRLK